MKWSCKNNLRKNDKVYFYCCFYVKQICDDFCKFKFIGHFLKQEWLNNGTEISSLFYNLGVFKKHIKQIIDVWMNILKMG